MSPLKALAAAALLLCATPAHAACLGYRSGSAALRECEEREALEDVARELRNQSFDAQMREWRRQREREQDRQEQLDERARCSVYRFWSSDERRQQGCP